MFMSHDWPLGVYHCGNLGMLLNRKRFLRGESRMLLSREEGGWSRTVYEIPIDTVSAVTQFFKLCLNCDAEHGC